MEKKEDAFLKSVVNIKSRKIKSEFQLLASFSAEKVSRTACQAFEKKEKKQKKKLRIWGTKYLIIQIHLNLSLVLKFLMM